MSLSDNKKRLTWYDGTKSFLKSYVAATSAEIYVGALVAIDTNGRAVEAVNTKQFVGVATNYVKQDATIDNDNYVVVETNQIEKLDAPATASVGYIGKAVGATADDTIATLAATYTTDTYAVNRVGVVVDYEGTDYLWVKIAPFSS